VIAEALRTVVAGDALSRAQARGAIESIMRGEAEPLLVAALLAALRQRGETTDELLGAAEAMRALAVPLPPAPPGAIDTCGTGGDGSGSFNISTVAALVVAGAGVAVAKHGNRAATSACGSADVLEALDVNIEIAPARMAEAVRSVGIGFLFARACHPAMAAVAPIRAALPIPTLFNRLGPLTNPMAPPCQLLGVGAADMMESSVEVLAGLGVERLWVVHGEDGLDEVSSCAATRVLALEQGARREFTIAAGAHVPLADAGDLAGGDAATNAAIAREVLAGKPGPRRDAVLLNAAAALCVSGRSASLDKGVARAAEAIDTGAARDVLERFVAFTGEAV